MKTAELTGAALDWAVAKCEGWPMTWDENAEDFFLGLWVPLCFLKEFSPSTDWSQGGPIIEREGIELAMFSDQWRAVVHLESDSFYQDGSRPLIAAMRCYVSSKLGDSVEIPKELTE